jgi:hypothetical protein
MFPGRSRSASHFSSGRAIDRTARDALALGDEDLNDHEQLRDDPLLAVLCGRRNVGGERLAGKSTFNRLELGAGAPSRYKKIHYDAGAIDELLVNLFTEAHDAAPASIVLDLDATDLPLHGHQEGRFFHGFYDSYCYLPLYIFCGDQLLCARLRRSDIDAAAGSREEVERIVQQIRRAWPDVQIILRADSGFCREELMRWCEDHRVDYVFGFARNERLAKLIEPHMDEARGLYAQTGKPARVFTEFSYQTTTGVGLGRGVRWWPKPSNWMANRTALHRHLIHGRTVARRLYEDFCARGEMENRIRSR